MFELLGERHQAGLSYLELGRLAAAAGARSRATRYLTDAVSIFEALGAIPDLAEARLALEAIPIAMTGGYVGVQMDGEDALVRRIVDAAVMPALLAREGATALLEACDAHAAVIFIELPTGQVKVASNAGCSLEEGRTLALGVVRRIDASDSPAVPVEPLGRDADGPRFAAVSAPARSPERRASVFARCAPCCGRGSTSAPPASGPLKPSAAASSGRWSRSSPDSSARARRCTEWPSRFNGCRATTSPS